MKFSKQFWLIFLLFLGLRFYFIAMFPSFTDESLYIRWGQLMIRLDDFRWISISQLSRQPLALWILGFGSTLTRDPIIGARLLVLLFNIPVFFLVYEMTKKLYNEKSALVAVFLLSTIPLCILTQSLALMDGFIFALGTLLLYILSTEKKNTLAIGIVLGLSLWIKTTGLYLVLFTILTLVLQRKKVKLVTIIPVVCIIILPLLLRSDMQNLLNEPNSFLFTIKELSVFPIAIWGAHLYETIIGLFLYLNPIFWIIVLLSYNAVKKQSWTTAIIWIGIPIIIDLILGKNFRFRYFTFGFAALLPVISAFVHEKFSNKPLVIGFIMYSLFFIINPPAFYSLFPTSSGERDYALSWPSGYGMREAAGWIDTNQPMVIAVVDSPGNPGDYILARFSESPNIKIVFVTLSTPSEFSKIFPLVSKIPVYLVTRSSLIPQWAATNLRPVQTFSKPYTQEVIGIYQIFL